MAFNELSQNLWGLYNSSPISFWLLLCGVSALFGIVPGAIVSLINANELLKGWLICCITIFILLLLAPLVVGSENQLIHIVSSPGVWSFFIGSGVTVIIYGKLIKVRS